MAPLGPSTNKNADANAKAKQVKPREREPKPAYECTPSDQPYRARLGSPKGLHAMMASQAPPIGSSGLIAVALIIRSRDGPRFVFHHPPRPSTEASQEERLYGTELDESEPEYSSEQGLDSDDSDLEDGGYSMPRRAKVEKDNKPKLKLSHVVEVEGDDHYDKPNGEHVVPWEHLFEFDTTDLESILTPSRAYHKKKFELSLDPLYFVSYPMHIREDGLWKKKSKKARKVKKEESEAGMGSAETKSIEVEMNDVSLKEKPDNTSEDGDDHGGMTMFNVVFVLNVPKDEADERINVIYEHVIKKFNKALKHAQASANYVWKESEMILSMKEKAKEESKQFKSIFWFLLTAEQDVP
jgi:hypothetical protein